MREIILRFPDEVSAINVRPIMQGMDDKGHFQITQESAQFVNLTKYNYAVWDKKEGWHMCEV